MTPLTAGRSGAGALLAALLLALGCGSPAAPAPPAPLPPTPLAPSAGGEPSPAATAPAALPPGQDPGALPDTPLYDQPDLPPVPEELSGVMVAETGDGALLRVSLEGGQPRLLLPSLPPGALATSPAVSPDGRTVAFAYFAPQEGEPGYGPFGIWLASLASGEMRELTTPQSPQGSFAFPAWSPDGRWVYFNAFDPILDQEGNFAGVEIRLVRLPPEGGEVETVLTEALFPTLSADGQMLSFMRRDPETFVASLWVSGPQGESPRQILDGEDFLALQFPAVSPDGRWVAFAADAPVVARGWLERLLSPPPARAHGLPLSLYLVEVESGEMRALTDWSADDIAPAWSPDGRWAVYQGVGTLVLADPQDGQAYRGPPTWGRGGLSWAPPPE